MTKSHPFIDRVQANYALTGHLICVGLDPDPAYIPSYYPTDISGVFQFLTDVVDASLSHCVCFKPNISFFEALGIEGLEMLRRLIAYIPKTHPVILDAKRGDIGNTSKMQAKYLFDVMGADAATLHPYMGEDSVIPFFEYREKFHFVLGLTSNSGASTFETQRMYSSQCLYEHVVRQCSNWNTLFNNVGVVVGATHAELQSIRGIDSHLLFLIPGVGAQGGDYAHAVEFGKNNQGLCLVNASRSVLYGDTTETPRFSERITSDLILNRIHSIR